jgi:hypothetical protein
VQSPVVLGAASGIRPAELVQPDLGLVAVADAELEHVQLVGQRPALDQPVAVVQQRRDDLANSGQVAGVALAAGQRLLVRPAGRLLPPVQGPPVEPVEVPDAALAAGAPVLQRHPVPTVRSGQPQRVGGALHRADQPGRRRGHGPAAEQPARVAQRPGRADQHHAVQVEDRRRAGVVAEARVVADEQQHVGDAEQPGAEQVGLQRDPVAVPAGQLHHRLQPGALGEHRAGHCRWHHAGAGVVGDVDRVHPAGQRFGLGVDPVRVDAVRQVELGGHREPSGLDRAAQPRGHAALPAVGQIGSRVRMPSGSAHRPSSRPCQ